VCYYGIPTGPWGSNASRMLRPGDEPVKSNESIDFTILDVSGYEPPRVTSNPLNQCLRSSIIPAKYTCSSKFFAFWMRSHLSIATTAAVGAIGKGIALEFKHKYPVD